MVEDIVIELQGLAANAQLVPYRSTVQVAMLRAAGEIQKLRGQLTVAHAETYLASIRPAEPQG